MTDERAPRRPHGLPLWFVTLLATAAGAILVAGLFFLHERLRSLEEQIAHRRPIVKVPGTPAAPAPLASGARAAYVPAYSHIYALGGRSVLLETTLSVRNTSPSGTVTVHSVRYFDTDGNEVRSFLDQPLALGPLATAEFLVESKDTSGGSGANFIVEWSGETVSEAPIIDAVMVGMAGVHGLSFASRAVELARP